MTTSFVTVRHRCDFCRRSYANASPARKHEARCHQNPATHSCPTCLHWEHEWDGDTCAIGLADMPDNLGYGPSTMRWMPHCAGWVARRPEGGES